VDWNEESFEAHYHDSALMFAKPITPTISKNVIPGSCGGMSELLKIWLQQCAKQVFE